MKVVNRFPSILAAALLLLTLLTPLASHAVTLTIDVWTDQVIYNPNEIVTITGYVESDGSPAVGALVIVTVKKPNGDVALTRYLTTNATGHFQLLFNVSSFLYGDVYGDWNVIAQLSGGPSDTAIFIVGTPTLEVTSPAPGSTFTVNDTVTIAGSFYVSENGEGIGNTTVTIEVTNGTSTVFNDTVTTDANGNFDTSFTITSDMVSGPTTFTITVSSTLTGTTVSTSINVEPATGGVTPSPTPTPTPTPGGDLVGGVLIGGPSEGLGLIALIPIAGLIAVIAYKIRKK